MVEKLKVLIGVFREVLKTPIEKSSNVMAEYDGKHCKVYLTNGARLVGTVHVLDTPGWVKIEGANRCSKLRISQISSIVEVI